MGFEKGNSTKVYFLEKNQLLTTIPRSLAQAYGFVKNSLKLVFLFKTSLKAI